MMLLTNLSISCFIVESSMQLNCISESPVNNQQIVLIPYDATITGGNNIRLTYSNCNTLATNIRG